MRIATWNMEGKGSARHVAFLNAMACDALLLTEVPHDLDLEHGSLARSGAMGPGKDWSAVWTKQPASPREAPHEVTAAAELAGVLLVCSVLPWKGAGNHEYWRGRGTDTATRTVAALDEIEPLLRAETGPVVFGGDFNHALEGREVAGSAAGRDAISELLIALELRAPTASLPHRLDDLSSIDHVAIPSSWTVTSADRIVGADELGDLSDHDAYVVDASPGS